MPCLSRIINLEWYHSGLDFPGWATHSTFRPAMLDLLRESKSRGAPRVWIRNPSMSYRLSKYLLIVLSLIIGGSAQAGKPDDWTEAEVRLAAPYCIDTMGFRYGDAYSANISPRAGHWVGMMGQSFWNMHHYCWALINLARAERATTPATTRDYLRQSAVGDIKYVINGAKPGFIMLPEIYTRLGETYLLLRQERKADQAFKAAIAAKPDYWPPYARWAEYQKFRGRPRDEIRATLREGLRYSPTSKTLLGLWAEVGGGPLPEPVVVKPQDEAEGKAAPEDNGAKPVAAESAGAKAPETATGEKPPAP